MSVARGEMNINYSNKHLQIGVAYGIPILFFAWAFHYIATHPHDFVKLFSLSLSLVLLLIFIQLISIWISGLFTLFMVKPYGIELTFHDYFGITVVSRSLNIILPMKGGAAVRGLYLKQQHNLSLTDFSAIFAWQSLLTLFVASLLGLSGLAWLFLQTNEIDRLGLIIFSSAVLIFGVLICWPPTINNTQNEKIKKLQNVLDSWKKLRTNRTVIIKISLLSFINTALSTASIALIFFALDNPQALGAALYLGGNQDVMYHASITPGALGVVEASTVFLSKNISINVSDALLVALINRTLIFSVSGLLTPFYIHRILKKQSLIRTKI